MIEFAIPGTGPFLITPDETDPLGPEVFPPILQPVIIDGLSENGFLGAPSTTPVIVLDKAGPPGDGVGLEILAPDVTVKGLVISNRKANPSWIGLSLFGGRSLIQDCYIGTDPSGNQPGREQPPAGYETGILIGSSDNTIGGTAGDGRNVISGNVDFGIVIDGRIALPATGNLVAGNYIGTTADGARPLPNQTGVFVWNSGGNTIGGPDGSGNVLSGNRSTNLQIQGDATGNLVQGNIIGLDADARDPVVAPDASPGIGVLIDGARDNTIGGLTTDRRNVISGNTGPGIRMQRGASANLVQGNFIGTRADGQSTVHNAIGIQIQDSFANTIGGTNLAPNVIFGNRVANVDIAGISSANVVTGNRIGTDITGRARATRPEEVDVVGILIDGAGNNTIGGTTQDGLYNVISGNATGVLIQRGGSGNVVLGNAIGTDATGRDPNGNLEGVVINGSADNTIGGRHFGGVANTISGNANNGVWILGRDATGNFVAGNIIGGIRGSSDTSLGNGGKGILIEDAPGNRIGDSLFGNGNTIVANRSHGILIRGTDASGNLVESNNIGVTETPSGHVESGNAQDGVVISDAPQNTIRNNLISGNGANGVVIFGNDAYGSHIAGNLIGIGSNFELARSIRLANAANGIYIVGARDTLIDDYNVISGNGVNGIEIASGATATVVQDSYVGIDGEDEVVIPNQGNGIVIDESSDNSIGSVTSESFRNIISGNRGDGILIRHGSTGNHVHGSLIGTSLDGERSLGNAGNGIRIDNSHGNSIGGPASRYDNLISGNGLSGIQFDNASFDNHIINNYIGTNDNGNRAVANLGGGVSISDSADNTIASNLISGNVGNGVFIFTSERNRLISNTIGGRSGQPEQSSGVYIFSSSDNIVGGARGLESNTIKNNSDSGIVIDGTPNFLSTGNRVEGNNISLNGRGPTLGAGVEISGHTRGTVIGPFNSIELNGYGVRIADDPTNQRWHVTGNRIWDNVEGDLVTPSGSTNNITRLDPPFSGSIHIEGTLQGEPDTAYRVEFFASSGTGVDGAGEAEEYLGSETFTTDDTGQVPFQVVFDDPIPVGWHITTTVTGPDGETTGFSPPMAVTPAPPPDSVTVSDVTRPAADVGTTPFVFTVSLRNPTGNPVTVQVDTADGTATAAGGDYLPVLGQILTFTPGGPTQQQVTVLVNPKSVHDANRTFTVNLTSVSGGSIGRAGIGTILDHHPRSLSIDDVSLPVGGDGPTAFAFTVSLSGPTLEPISVRVDTTDGTASAARGDYRPISGQIVTFEPGGPTTQTVTVLVDPSFTTGPDRTFTVNLSQATGTNVSIARTTGVGTIQAGGPTATPTVVTTTAGSGPGSLQEAILYANEHPGLDLITFNIPDPGVRYIRSFLPEITDPVIIDGYSQPGARPNTLAEGNNAVLLIELALGEFASPDGYGYPFVISAGNSTVRGLVIHGTGLRLTGNGGNRIEGNFFGTDATGRSLPLPFFSGGGTVFIDRSSRNTIGGTTPEARNVLSAGPFNGSGILIGSVFSTLDGGHSDENVIQGNYIGTDASGTAYLGNAGDGVRINFGTGNIIGGTEPGAGNVISGNSQHNVFLSYGSYSNRVQGNLIGTDATGTRSLGNSLSLSDNSLGVGVGIFGSDDNTIGGTESGAGNVISGTVTRSQFLPYGGGSGIHIFGGYPIIGDPSNPVLEIATGNVIQGNLIGTDATGTASLPNESHGIYVDAFVSGTVIGGEAPGARNIISGNTGSGIHLAPGIGEPGLVLPPPAEVPFATAPPMGAVIRGNVIGTDITGSHPLPNGGDGITVVNSPDNTIGGTSEAAGNLISANGGDGIRIEGDWAALNVVQGNLIGTAADGLTALGNASAGVAVGDGARNNIIGGRPPTHHTITLKSDASTLASSVSSPFAQAILDTGPPTTSGVSYGPALVGPFGTFTPVPPGAPDGTSVVNITPGDGQSGYFAMTFILPLDFAEVSLAGSANADDLGRAFLNGHAISPSMFSDDPQRITQFGNATFSTSDRTLFLPGLNVLIVADYSSDGPSGAAFYATITYATPMDADGSGSGNVISGNGSSGVELGGLGTSGNRLQGNLIGTDVFANLPLGNAHDGVLIRDGASANLVGGPQGEGNFIAFNGGRGVAAIGDDTDGNAILGNFVVGNADLGIDLAGDGVTLNDSGGHTGPNQLQSFPVLTSAMSDAAGTTVTGLLRSSPDRAFRLEFFASTSADPSGFGEGEIYLGSTEVTTGGDGNVSFTTSLPFALVGHHVIAATATALADDEPSTPADTSEFSRAIPVDAVADAVVVVAPDLGTIDAGDPAGFTITLTNQGNGDASDVTFGAPLPAGLSGALNWQIDPSSPDAGSFQITGAVGSQVLVLAPGVTTLEAGQALSIHITALTGAEDTDAATFLGTLTLTARVSVANDPPDPQDQQAGASITVRAPEVKVSQTADLASINAGDLAGFTLTITNIGAGTADGLTLSEPLPAGLGHDIDWAIDGSSPDASSFRISGPIGSQVLALAPGVQTLEPGQTLTVHFTGVTSPEDTDAGTFQGLLTGTATAGAANERIGSRDEQATATILVGASDLDVALTPDDSSIDVGDTAGFTVTVVNQGRAPATGIRLQGLLPAGDGTSLNWAIDASTGDSGAFVIAGPTGRQVLGLAPGAESLAPGRTLSVHLRAQTTDRDGGTLYALALVEADNERVGDPDDRADATIAVTIPGVTVSTVADDPTIDAGDTAGFTITITNQSPVNLAVLDAPLPAGLGGDIDWQIDGTGPDAGLFRITGPIGGQVLSLAQDRRILGPGEDLVVHVTGQTTFRDTDPGTSQGTITGVAMVHFGGRLDQVRSAQATVTIQAVARTITISGQVFRDIDRDGSLGQGEPGLSGWTVELFAAGSTSPAATATTDAGGAYSFPGLGGGTYRVREVPAQGWDQTSANPADIVADGGVDVVGINFGNHAVTPPDVAPAARLDDGQPGSSLIGPWSVATGTGWNNRDRQLSTDGAGTGTRVARWVLRAAPGMYEVFVTYPAGAANVARAPYSILFGGSTVATVERNQQQVPDDASYGGVLWESLGVYTFASTSTLVSVTVQLTDLGTAGRLIADGAMLVPFTADVPLQAGSADLGTGRPLMAAPRAPAPPEVRALGQGSVVGPASPKAPEDVRISIADLPAAGPRPQPAARPTIPAARAVNSPANVGVPEDAPAAAPAEAQDPTPLPTPAPDFRRLVRVRARRRVARPPTNPIPAGPGFMAMRPAGRMHAGAPTMARTLWKTARIPRTTLPSSGPSHENAGPSRSAEI